MQIPKTLKIGGHDVRVKFPTDFNDISGSARWHGYAHVNEDRISITADKSISGDTLKIILLHEILHFIDSVYLDRKILDELGNTIIDTFAEGLYQVLKDNRLAFWEILELDTQAPLESAHAND